MTAKPGNSTRLIDPIQSITPDTYVSAPRTLVASPELALDRDPVPDQLPAPATTPVHAFEMRFTSTLRGARLARRLAAVRLDAWGIPYDTDAHDAIVLIVAEFGANAVRHGHVPGRDFHLGLCVLAGAARTVRVEVTDTRGERMPRCPVPPEDAGVAEVEEAGRGLFLVSRLAARWGWYPRASGPGKTVWAEYECPELS